MVESLLEMSLEDVTPDLARRSGFKGVVGLLKVAKHGRGRRVFLVEFRYEDERVVPRSSDLEGRPVGDAD